MKECDLIMKGGITSGVVYPKAITSLAQDYKFVNIGGTSAGAIGAVIAAAAEYRRQASSDATNNSGFEAIEKIPDELGENLLGLFVPYPPLKAIFNTLIDIISADENTSKLGVALWGLVKHHPRTSMFIGIITLSLIAAGLVLGQIGWSLFFLLSGILVLAGVLLAYLNTAFSMHLKENHFGLCTGTRIPEPTGGKILSTFRKLYWRSTPIEKIAPFTDWMSTKIDNVAFGIKPNESSRPLLIGDLREHGIELASMTTDLSSRRPYQLPLQSKDHYFKRSEFERLFPPNVLAYLLEDNDPVAWREDEHGNAHEADALEYYSLPIGDEMPVLFIARLSLSFPGLISAIPLYRRDYGLRGSMGGYAPMKQCLFSDGGISSNFPVHFFDNWLPSRPTFGINLTSYEIERHASSSSHEDDAGSDNRVNLPQEPQSSRTMPVFEVTNMFGFLASILNTAKDWQDNLQGLLPGYSERIVEVRLSPKEGGMNLTMTPETIGKLTSYGSLAGDKLKEFDFSEHSYRRAITTVPFMEESLGHFSRVYGDLNWQGDDGESWVDIFENYESENYKIPSKKWRKNVLHKAAKDAHSIGQISFEKDVNESLLRDYKRIPYFDASIRLVASPMRMRRDRWVEIRKSRNKDT